MPRARRFAVAALGNVPGDVRDDVALVVTELVTNALLHGRPPVEVAVARTELGARVEVRDGSPVPPIRPVDNPEAMTGRGLSLVDALTRKWGVERRRDGKVVWAEVGGDVAAGAGVGEPSDAELDALLDAWDDEAAEPTFEVRLGSVPTRLLLAAKAHVDNLVREFTLVAAGAQSPGGTPMPAHVAEVVDRVVHRFAGARTAIKRQAVAAAERGEPTTELTLHLPLSAADAGEQYLAGLDEADEFARAARLLTVETPPAHRVFRHWYVGELVRQLRARAAGAQPPPVTPFQERLAEEFDRLGGAFAHAERLGRLHRVSGALAGATTMQEAAQVLVREGVEALHASGGTVLLVDAEGVAVPAAVGYSESLVARLREESPDDHLPAMVAARTGQALWIEGLDELRRVFPDLAEFEPWTQALCAVPVVLGGRTLGALRFSFDGPRLFDEAERDFVDALAAQAAVALHRAELYESERAAREQAEQLSDILADTAHRLTVLQRLTAELAAVESRQDAAEILVRTATEVIGAYAARLFLLDETGEVAREIAIATVDRRLRDMPGYVRISDPLPAAAALRAQRPLVFGSVAEIEERFPAFAGVFTEDVTLLTAPLATGGRQLGVLALVFRAGELDPAAQLAFLVALADSGAQAIERTNATADARQSADRLAFLADASAVLSSSLDYRTTVSRVAALAVPRVADWCAVHLGTAEDVELAAAAHADPEKRAAVGALSEQLLGRDGVADVIRTGVARLQAGAGGAALIAVPLTGRTGVLGALLLAYGESGRRYDDSDLRFAEDLGRRIAVAVETATRFEEQQGRLAAVTQIAQVAQHAILAPPPTRLGPVALSAAYTSAAAEAQIGGDLYEVVQRAGAVRLLVGDVRGKGLAAVRTATIVLGEFRSAAVDREDLPDVARQMDARVTPYLQPEDFVTAVLAEITDAGEVTIVSCGHPAPLLVAAGTLSEVAVPAATVPLGLGADPKPVRARLAPGDRLFLYTDGLLEARGPDGRFVDVSAALAPLGTAPLHQALEDVLDVLRGAVGGSLGDDLALLLAQYDG